MRTAVFVLILAVFLCPLLFPVSRIREVEATTIYTPTITIQADGSIDPPTPLILRNGNYYTLTDNIISSYDVDGIVIERDSITLDGEGFTLQGGGSGAVQRRGVDLTGRMNVTVQNTQIKNYSIGICLDSTNYTKISGNTLANNTDGIDILYSFYNNATGNSIVANSFDGILLDSSLNISIDGNNVANNQNGVWLASSNNNSITGNNITANSNDGIKFVSSSNNTIYHNNFLDNIAAQASTDAISHNSWDDGSRGNYWSDYLLRYPSASEIDNSGIGNTTYVIFATSKDRYPLMTQYIIPEYSSFLILPLFMLASLISALFLKRRRHANTVSG